VFSIVDGMLWRPLEFAGADRVVSLVSRENGFIAGMRLAQFDELSEQQTVFETVAAYVTFYSVVSGGAPGSDVGATRSVVGAYVTSSFFDVAPIAPLLGRHLSAEDAATLESPAAIIGHDLWQRLFGGDPDVVGRAAVVNGLHTEVVGVLPAGAHFPYRHDLWLTIPKDVAEYPWSFLIAGRLRADTTLEEAQTPGSLRDVGHFSVARSRLRGERRRRQQDGDRESSPRAAALRR
jgi:hypothetical protein